MPPSPQFHEANSESRPLSDEDVAVLHQIVVRAQTDESVTRRPKKALFQAYEAVFAENQLDTNQDRACLRVLLQLGGPGIPGASLYDKFEYLLKKLGITLVFGDDDVSAIVTDGLTTLDEVENDYQPAGAGLQGNSRKPDRRNSFTSMYDLTNEIVRSSRRRTSHSRASVSRLQTPKPNFPDLASRRKLSNDSSTKPPYSAGMESVQPGRNRYGSKLIGPVRLSTENHIRLGLGDSTASNSDDVSIRQDTSQRSAFFDRSSAHKASPIELSELPYPPTDTHLIRDAGRFDDFRMQLLVKQLFDGWLARTRSQLAKSRILEQEAKNKDDLTLQRQAFDIWRVTYGRLLQEAQVGRFFEHLYNRAGLTYDQYLKLKAFSHWYETSLQAAARTNAARQKYLHIKYFNAWVKLTVTNELKAERQGLKSPLHLLRRKAIQYYTDQVDSLALYHHNLTKYVFWRWFWEFCDRGVPKYRDDVLKKRAISVWSRNLQVNRRRELQAEGTFKQVTVRGAFQLWARKTRIDVAGNRQADAFRRRHLLKTSVGDWKTESQLAPLASRLVHMSDWRIARTNFGMWLHRSRMTVSANAVDLLRTKQNAFTAWNDRLRHQTLGALLDERILAQKLYKWVLSQRTILMCRLHNQTVKEAAFRLLVQGFRKHRGRLMAQEIRASSLQHLNSMTSTFQLWRNHVTMNHGQSRVATKFHIAKVERGTFAIWQTRAREVQREEMWSKDAAFYFVMTKLLKRWHGAAVESRKKRQQEAYKKMRKQLKIKLARNVMNQWRLRIESSRVMHEHAVGIDAAKRRALVRQLLGKWHDLADRGRRVVSVACTVYENRLASNGLRAWVNALRQITTMQSRADQFYQIRLSEVCSMQLRRTSMRAFGVKRRQQDADAMQERHGGKHFRNIFRHWAAKTKEITYQASMAEPSPSAEQEPTDAGYGTASNDDPPPAAGVTFGITQRAEEWTAFDGELLEGDDWIPPVDEAPQDTSTPMPTPGYLNTPSKRVARARALASISTTPLVTPFAARLRAGMANSSRAKTASTAKKDGVRQERSRLEDE